MQIVTKFARDLKVGDVVVMIATMQVPPVLHYNANGDVLIHHSEVIDLQDGWEDAPVFDPIEQDMTPQDSFDRALSGNPYTKSELAKIRVEAANAQPNAGKKFPTYRVYLAGFENGDKLDQAPAEYVLRALDIVQVVEGNMSDQLLLPAGNQAPNET